MEERPKKRGLNWGITFSRTTSEGHAGAENESAAEDEGDQRKQEHGGHEEDELKQENHLRPFEMSMM